MLWRSYVRIYEVKLDLGGDLRRTYQILGPTFYVFLDDLLLQAFNVLFYGIHFNVFILHMLLQCSCRGVEGTMLDDRFFRGTGCKLRIVSTTRIMGQLTLHRPLRQLCVSAEQLIGPFWHLMPPAETWWKEDGELSLKKPT